VYNVNALPSLRSADETGATSTILHFIESDSVMTQPGRRGALKSIPGIGGQPERLRPPPGLTDLEREAFASIVGSCRPDHFVASDLPLVASYARAIVADAGAARQLQEQGAVVNGKPNPWLVVKEKAHREMVALSLRLRLSPQGRAQVAKSAPGTPISYYEHRQLLGADDEAEPS
jgi:hypothetical protein